MRFVPFLLVMVALFGGLVSTSGAQTADGTKETPALKLERWDAESGFVEQRIAEVAPNSGEIEGMRATFEAQRSEIPNLIAEAEAALQPLRRQLEALGKVPEDGTSEADGIVAERAKLSQRIASIEARLKRLGQSDARAAALLSQLADLRRKLFTRELLTRGPNLIEAGMVRRGFDSLGQVAAVIHSETAERISQSRMGTPLALRILAPLSLIGLILFLILGLKRAVLRRLTRPPGTSAGGRRDRLVLTGIGVTLIRLLMPAGALAIALVAIWNSGLIGAQGEILLRGIAATVLIVIGAYALGGAFYAPQFPWLRLSALPDYGAVAANRWLMALAAIVGLDRVLVVQGEALGLSIEGLGLLNAGLLVLGGIAVWGYTGYIAIGRPDESAEPTVDGELKQSVGENGETWLGPMLITTARVIARVAAIIAPILGLIGYFAGSRFLFYPIVFSGAMIGLCILLFHAVQDTVDRIAAPVGEEAPSPSRIRLIPVAVAFLLICAAVPVLALIWGADSTDLSAWWRAISDGFSIGNVVISPLVFFSFLLVFSIGFVLTRIFQGILGRSVLPVTRLDAGGRAAILAGVGYLGTILAALVAISTTGLDLSNLAIVAGALSVGIGFGLQNIVNNFVSGLILLIERPIKAGDWVELSSGSGYVKQVNVRSTEIQTFDRASLIVPNSELISSAVINWTHTDLNGRLIVPIGVAYGTDPKRVETILTEIAEANPMLLRIPAPYVLFRRFGADALEFELRGVLRDVNWILNVTSEINFEISRRFAEEGIEIPFAQRDLHLRNAGDLGRSIGDAIRGGQGAAASKPRPTAAPAPREQRQRPDAARDDPDADN